MPTISKDHEGHIFPSMMSMCKHWGIGYSTFIDRLEHGWSIESALTTPIIRGRVKGIPCKDHLGNKYPSYKSMCAHWRTTDSTLKYRLRHGFTLKEALEHVDNK